jgi:hypothetical protein
MLQTEPEVEPAAQTQVAVVAVEITVNQAARVL